jgi:hypothetical protein
MYTKLYYLHDWIQALKYAVDRLFHLAGTDIATELVYMYAKSCRLLDHIEALKYAVDRSFQCPVLDRYPWYHHLGVKMPTVDDYELVYTYADAVACLMS